MFVWIACDLSDSLAKVREESLVLNKDIRADEVAFSLPPHISLKISFEVADGLVNEVLPDIKKYLEGVEPFTVDGPTPELCGNIIWLRFNEEKPLLKMHDDLDELLFDKYGVPLHEFDRSFAFHSTLFIDKDVGKLERLMPVIADLKLPSRVRIDSFIIGISESGKVGEYRVIENILAKCK